MVRNTLPTPPAHWDPFRSLSDLRREMNFLFERSLGRDLPLDPENGGGFAWLPETELLEEDKHYVVRMDLPGLDREDVDITLSGNVLTVQGERKCEKERKDEHVHVSERSYGRFLRRFTLPQGAGTEPVSASMKKGVLEIRLAKLAESRTKKIAIQG